MKSAEKPGCIQLCSSVTDGMTMHQTLLLPSSIPQSSQENKIEKH